MPQWMIPNVLLLGNGLNRCFAGDAWNALIRKISAREDLPEPMALPMPLQVVLATNGHVSTGMKTAKEELRGIIPGGEMLCMLQKMLSLGFHDMLTTNYSYELEQATNPAKRISDYALTKMCSHTKAVAMAEPRYMLHTFYQVEYEGISNRIWHIHGEARKPEGMIIGHYYYASLLSKMKQYSDKRAGDYEQCYAEGKELPNESWLDSFIMGNVYVLGFGFDPSEFDLWWLLNRKQREKAAHGKVVFYEPDYGLNFDEKKELLKVMGAEVCDLGKRIEKDDAERNEKYRAFYQLAMKDIEIRLSKEKKGES